MEEPPERVETVTDASDTKNLLQNDDKNTSDTKNLLQNDDKNKNDECGDRESAREPEKDSGQNPISKNQLKRQRKHEKWLQIKDQKRKEEKIKKKKRFAEAREKGELIGPTRKSLKKNCMQDSSCKIRVALDCSFDTYMTSKDVVHLIQQIQHSYAVNRRAENPLQFYVCGVDGKTKERLENIGDYKGWDVYMEDKNYLDTFDKDSIVYLSSESPNILEKLEEDKAYIIGGLVDHNHYKGMCHKLAEEKGLMHAQLPIGEYIEMKSRKVLTINHVFEILLKYTETGDWKAAFYHVLPQRKGFSAREKQTREDGQTCKDIHDNIETKNLPQLYDEHSSVIRETTVHSSEEVAVTSLESTEVSDCLPANSDCSLDCEQINKKIVSDKETLT